MAPECASEGPEMLQAVIARNSSLPYILLAIFLSRATEQDLPLLRTFKVWLTKHRKLSSWSRAKRNQQSVVAKSALLRIAQPLLSLTRYHRLSSEPLQNRESREKVEHASAADYGRESSTGIDVVTNLGGV